MEREKIELPKDEALRLAKGEEGDAESGYGLEIDVHVTNFTRKERRQLVIRRRSDGKLFAITYEQGRMGESEPFEGMDPVPFTEVEARTRVIVVYE